MPYNEQYVAAKALLKQKSKYVCYEDILLQVLKSGGSLIAKDCEGDEDPCEIVLVDVLTNIELVPIKTLMEFANEQDDADSADIVLQYCFFGEIIYA